MLGDIVREVTSANVFHHEKVDAIPIVGIVRGRDVWMREFRGGTRLALESLTLPGESTADRGNTFNATTRSIDFCSALKTTPIPPEPTASRIRYLSIKEDHSSSGAARRPGNS